jgi:hypothetical protein
VCLLWLSASTAQPAVNQKCDLAALSATCINNNIGRGGTTCSCPVHCPSKCINITNCLICHPTSGVSSDASASSENPQYLCAMCEGGFSLSSNKSECQPCPLGTYASAADTSAGVAGSGCTACPQGLSTPKNASTSAAACTGEPLASCCPCCLTLT